MDEKNGLNEDDINFIETILTFASTLQNPVAESEEFNNKVNNKINSLFPERKVKINRKGTYLDFKNILNENKIFINLSELLSRYHSQGICKDLCEKLLKEYNDNKNV
ncbi:MAG: hypothetical protein C6W58_02450 [Bacillaceae bacterium]|nr:MAG: hypothetical protein C6W58_02450 [Bacillaceae bacterium]